MNSLVFHPIKFCIMDKQYLTLDVISKALNLIEDHILAVYQFGSRVYQSHTKNSDFDIFVIYETDDYLDTVIENDEFKIGAHIHDVKTYKKYISQHNACVIQTLYLVEKFIIFEHKELSNYRKKFMISMKKMERSFLRVESICLLKSKREFIYDKKKSLKNLVHGVRFLLFGLQIAKTGKIYDFTVGNTYYEYMLSLDFDTWDEYHQKFENIYHKLHNEFSEYIFEEKTKIYEKYSKKGKEKLQLIQFLKENKLEYLTKIFSIQIDFLENGLMSFEYDPVFSNTTCLINQECRSTVILNQVTNEKFQKLTL